MSFFLGAPPDRVDLAHFPKVARQHALAADGLPVPPGVVLDLARAQQLFAATASLEPNAATDSDPARLWVREQLDAGRSLIARCASTIEDREHASGAGLSMSVAGLSSTRALASALMMIAAHGRAAGLDDPGGRRTLILIQREVPRHALLVAVRGGATTDRFYAESHGPEAGPEPLAEGRSPEWAGALDEWPDPARERVVALAERVGAREAGPQGVDLEIVVDGGGDPWLVQARPLTAPLHPGWPDFLAAIAADPDAEPTPNADPGSALPRGQLTLDGEHNPAPLSPAHAWITRRLAALRPEHSGSAVILAGWLYIRATPPSQPAEDPPMSARGALLWLREQALPAARRDLDAFDDLLGQRPPLREALAVAMAHFSTMSDDYAERLGPARRAALAYAPLFVDSPLRPGALPTTLRGREDFLDVLPAQWDIASPSLSELLGDEPDPREADSSAAWQPDRDALPRDEGEAARLLGEWDDHLFALGLAPLRQLWLHAADRLRFAAPERVFLLTGDELVDLDEGRGPHGRALDAHLDARARRWHAHARLDPPTRIVDGAPMPQPIGGHLRGLAIGETFTGPIAQRRDLRDLLSDPPPPQAVLCTPALTAQAAVALHRLGVRAVCTEYGGALAHGALMARELGLSALIGCRGCTRIIEGRLATVDTRARRLALAPARPPASKTS
ncbi:hypothetical protein G6O69_16115 [Pseudenhygromyxa sp. WMMC2535]|uniref:PEP-utilizing enzyme n=1 Tax=Pseudenhygromyxa sp. WMMC2535 TaxID=2712867 RepID=UPI001552BD35|nr:hypothetical protein [Pseudenhygromyxa sp. WMMC2535]